MIPSHVGQPATYKNIFPKSVNRIKTILAEFWLMILKWIGLVPCHTFRKFFYFLSGIKLTSTSTIHTGAEFFHPRSISIGQDTIIGKNCFLDGRGQLTIGSHTDIATDVLIYTDQHNIHSPNFTNQSAPVVIADYVFIGPRAIILPGVTIGKGAVVGAGAVVTKDVPQGEIWAGVPAKKIGLRQTDQLNYKLGRPVLFQ